MISAGCASRCSSCLDARGGEVTARAGPPLSAASICYSTTPVASGFYGCSPASSPSTTAEIDRCCAALTTAEGAAERAAAERALRQALTRRGSRCCASSTRSPEGVKFLVDLRAELLELVGTTRCSPDSSSISSELLASWFDVGFLEIRQITWDSPASLLEKLALRGGARDPRLDRSQEPARRRPPLLRVLAPAHAGRAADLRRGRAGRRDVGRDALAARQARTAAIRRSDRTRSSTRSPTVRRDSPGSASATRDQARGRCLGQGPAAAQGVPRPCRRCRGFALARSPDRGGARRPAAAGGAHRDRGARRRHRRTRSRGPARPRRPECRAAARRRAARAAVAPVCTLSAARAGAVGAGARPGCAFSPEQRRARRAA